MAAWVWAFARPGMTRHPEASRVREASYSAAIFAGLRSRQFDSRKWPGPGVKEAEFFGREGSPAGYERSAGFLESLLKSCLAIKVRKNLSQALIARSASDGNLISQIILFHSLASLRSQERPKQLRSNLKFAFGNFQFAMEFLLLGKC